MKYSYPHNDWEVRKKFCEFQPWLSFASVKADLQYSNYRSELVHLEAQKIFLR